MSEHSQPLQLEEALAALGAQITPVGGAATVPLAEARGRILAEPVRAQVDLPPFASSAMDGYAVRSVDWRAGTATFDVVGESRAGHPYGGGVGQNQAVRIFTGAVVPPGADLVLLQEQAQTDGKQVRFTAHTPDEAYVRPIGHDVARGAVLADAGERVSPFTIGTLAAAGIEALSVKRQPRVAVFSSGDELVDAGVALGPGQIYDSNRAAVLALLADAPCTVADLGRLPDDPDEVAGRLAAAARENDLLLTSGGVSVGDADYITATIQDLGELGFWRLNLKPGKPLAFGRIDGCYVFGLPGNPVSTIVTLLLIARPAITRLAGGLPEPPMRCAAKLQDAVRHARGRTEYQRGILQTGEDGVLTVRHTGDQSSNRLQTCRGANCLIEVPGASGDLAAGERVLVLPFSGLLQA